MKEIPKISWK